MYTNLHSTSGYPGQDNSRTLDRIQTKPVTQGVLIGAGLTAAYYGLRPGPMKAAGRMITQTTSVTRAIGGAAAATVKTAIPMAASASKSILKTLWTAGHNASSAESRALDQADLIAKWNLGKHKWYDPSQIFERPGTHWYSGTLGAGNKWYKMTAGQSARQAFKSGFNWARMSLPIIGGKWGMLDMAIASTADNPFKAMAQSTMGAFGIAFGGRMGVAAAASLPKAGIFPKALGGVAGAAVGLLGGFAIDIAENFAKWGASSRGATFGRPFQDSQGAATMRQQSLMAIRNSELNQRNFILGNEARMLTGNW